ncbi:acyltransferase [Streptomyces sp. UNOC14_S4]|uniref:acyltransferase family protein n=1 Tax=Streptomyces sp. UNOC14_S4 TaxID=2872340 RepID=UPI001E55012B|nr:acyltransferase [Streptomyces sp. UNOC14_S4]MCC3770005.1 acyltransferase [Streptomyces sp. UNOC14_S4]
MPEELRSSGAPGASRLPELDLIRSVVVVGLVFFHSALVFAPHDTFYVKNDTTTGVALVAVALCVPTAMPMLFLIAGVGAWHSLRRRGPAGFVRERLVRLGVPLVVATLTIDPLPQWLRHRSAGPGYHDAYPTFLTHFYAIHMDWADFPFVLHGKDFEVGHLWFVVLLLTFSLPLAAAVRRISRARLRRILDRMAAVAGRPGAILLPALPLAAIDALLGLERGYAAWNRWAYLVFFLCGFVFAGDERFHAAMRRSARTAIGLGTLLSLAMLPAFLAHDAFFTGTDPLPVGARASYGAAGWCWLVAILGGLSLTHPSGTPDERGGRLLAYLSTAALPLYVLHQPIVVTVAYGVTGWNLPVPVKYLAISTASLALTVAAYELLVRRTRTTRFLAGMRPSGRAGASP